MVQVQRKVPVELSWPVLRIKTKVIRLWRTPRTLKAVQRFQELTSRAHVLRTTLDESMFRTSRTASEEAGMWSRMGQMLMKTAMTKQAARGCVPTAAIRNVWFSSEAKKNISNR